MASDETAQRQDACAGPEAVPGDGSPPPPRTPLQAPARHIHGTQTAPDLLVRGGGIFGLACAYECARRGARVRVLEPRRIGAGSSGGTVGALAPHVPELWNPKKQFQLESLLTAQAFWAGVTEISGIETGYARLGRLQPLHDADAVSRAQERIAGAQAHWGTAAEWRVTDVRAFGLAPLSATGLVVHDTLSARIAPRAACAALARAISLLGGEVVVATAQTAAAAPQDTPPAGRELHATGWEGLAELSEAFGRIIGNGVKGQSAVLRPRPGGPALVGAPQIYAEGLHIVPHADGTVALGSTSERDFSDPSATDGALDALLVRAQAVCPALAGAEVVDRWAGVRPRARSRAPMLGAWPGRPGHFIANGGFKIGFGMAPKVAGVMADLMLRGEDQIPAGFRVEDNL